MPLNDAKLRALPFAEQQREYPDRAGLYVRVGRKTKTFMLTIQQGGTRKRIAIGRYPDIGLAKARELAREKLGEVRTKTDELPALTFREALDRFERLHVPSMRPGSQKQVARILNAYFKDLERRRLPDLKTSEIAAILDGISASAEKRNAFVWLRTFLNWSCQRGHIDQNPMTRIKGMSASNQRDRVLTVAEIDQVWNATYQHHSDTYGALIRLLILSAQRKGEWLAFDPAFIQGDTIVFPGAVMKMGKSHTLPLTDGMRREIGNRATFGRWTTSYCKRALDPYSPDELGFLSAFNPVL